MPNPNPNVNPSPTLIIYPSSYPIPLASSTSLTLSLVRFTNQVTGMATGTGLADAGVSYASVEEAAQARLINAKPMAI